MDTTFKQRVAEAKTALVAQTEAANTIQQAAERERADEIEKHTEYAKQRIQHELSRLAATDLARGVAVLSFGRTTYTPVTADCAVSLVSTHTFGTVYSVPNHFIHQETRRALQTWLEVEGFRTVEITPGSPDTTGIQADILLEWDV